MSYTTLVKKLQEDFLFNPDFSAHLFESKWFSANLKAGKLATNFPVFYLINGFSNWRETQKL